MSSVNRIAYPVLTLVPNPVIASVGQTTTSVLAIWNVISLGYAPGSFTGSLCEGSPTGTVLATGSSGSFTISGATDGLQLYAVFHDADGNEFIADDIVQFQYPSQVNPNPATVTATPNPALVAPGQTTAWATFDWDASSITGVTGTSLVTGSTTVGTIDSPIGYTTGVIVTNGEVFTVVDQSNNPLCSVTIALQALPTLPTLSSGQVNIRYPVVVTETAVNEIVQFANFSEQRWVSAPPLAQFELTYSNVSPYDAANMQDFFISKKGDFIDYSLGNCFSVVLGSDTYTYCKFSSGGFEETESSPGTVAFTLKIEQVRVN